MSKRKSHRRRSSRKSHHHRKGLFALSNRRRHNPVRYLARHHRRHHRRHNPMFGGWGGKDYAFALGGAVVNGIQCRALPSALSSVFPTLAAYNSGWAGYFINGVFGAAGGWLIGKFDRRAGMGAWIGAGVAIVQRMISDYSQTGTVGTGVSGDLDYYSEPFPMPQGAAGGPYPAFPGSGSYPAAMLAPVNAAATARVAAASAGAPAAVASSGGKLPGSWTPNWA